MLLAGLVTDERGEKMSKVKGNVIDPIDVIKGATLEELLEKADKAGAKKAGVKYLKQTYPEGFIPYGADALRMTLLSYSPQSRRIALSIKRIEGYRNFANKLWNASRFALMNLSDSDAVATGEPPKAPKQLANRWILSRLGKVIDTVNQGLEDYRVDDAALGAYHFVWGELCDWYLELSKPLMASEDAEVVRETRQTLVHVLETTLRVLHPAMPFITEEIWQRVPKDGSFPESVMIARWPEPGREGVADEQAERDMVVLQGAITAARTIRAEHDLPRSKEIPLVLRAPDEAARAVIEREGLAIRTLCRATLELDSSGSTEIPPRHAVSVAEGVTVLVPLEGLVDLDKERERIERELKKVDKDLGGVEKKLANDKFVSKAPPEVVQKERERQRALTEEREQLRQALANL